MTLNIAAAANQLPPTFTAGSNTDHLFAAYPDCRHWAEQATTVAKRCVKLLGDTLFDAVMAYYSDAWFEARTWKDQAEAYKALLAAYEQEPCASLGALVMAFGGQAGPDLDPDRS